MGGEFGYCVRRVQALCEEQCTTVLASWAVSALETYCRHLQHLATAQHASTCKKPVTIVRQYLASRASMDKHGQTCGKSYQRDGFVRSWPWWRSLYHAASGVWYGARTGWREKYPAKDRGRSRYWSAWQEGRPERRTALWWRWRHYQSSTACGYPELHPYGASTSCRRRRSFASTTSSPKTNGSSIRREFTCAGLIGFMRLQLAIQGRKVALPVFKGGARKLGQAMATLLQENGFKDLRWPCWRRAGATMFTRARRGMCELRASGRSRSLRLARKYVVKWDSLPWTGGVVPWPQVEGGTPTTWGYEFESFRAREFWPRRQFMWDDDDDGWETEGSNAEETGKCLPQCGEDAAKVPNVRYRWVPRRRVHIPWSSADVQIKSQSEIPHCRSVRSWSLMRNGQPRHPNPNPGHHWSWRPGKQDRHGQDVEVPLLSRKDFGVCRVSRSGRKVQLDGWGLEFDDSCAHMPRTSTTNQRHRWQSQLWRSARRVRFPPNWGFRDLWGALFALFLTILMFARREGRFDAVEELLAAVSHMRVPDSRRNSRGHSVVPVEVAQKGLVVYPSLKTCGTGQFILRQLRRWAV